MLRRMLLYGKPLFTMTRCKCPPVLSIFLDALLCAVQPVTLTYLGCQGGRLARCRVDSKRLQQLDRLAALLDDHCRGRVLVLREATGRPVRRH